MFQIIGNVSEDLRKCQSFKWWHSLSNQCLVLINVQTSALSNCERFIHTFGAHFSSKYHNLTFIGKRHYLVYCILDFTNNLVHLNPATFLSTASSHTDFPSSNQQPGRTMYRPTFVIL